MRWWEIGILSIPYIVVIFMLLRQINIQNSAQAKERRELIDRISASSATRETFVPMNQLHEFLNSNMNHLHGEPRESTVHEVEGQDLQP